LAILTAPTAQAASSGAEPPSHRPLQARTAIWLGLLLLLVSALFRLYRLDSLPPGLYIDVATNGLDIRQVFAGHFPVFFARNYGREALFIYFQALLVAGAGPQPIVFAFSSVFMGMLTIALSLRLFTAMFGWRLALIGAGLLAMSFWFVDLSRFGLRTMSLPPLLILTLYLLWRTLRTGRWPYAALSGLALGLALYTYIAARLLPFLVVLIWLAEWRLAWKRRWQLALLVLVSLAVFAPEGVYFFEHRQEMLLRASQVSVFNPNPEAEGTHDTPVESVLNTAGMFFVRGDENVRHNIPHRPVFGPLLGACFAIGLGVALWLSRRRPAYRWPLLWLVVMCLPSALSHESPNSFRIVSVAPAACFFPALTLSKLPEWLRRPRLAYWLAGLVVAGSGILTWWLYFGQWARDPRTYWAYDGNLLPLASFVEQQTSPAGAYFALDHRSPVQFLAPVSESDRWYREESAAVPVPSQPADTVFVAGPKAALARLAPQLLPGAQALPHSEAPDGGPDFLAFRWPAPAESSLLAQRQPLDVAMPPDFQLTGYAVVQVDGKPALDVFWKPLDAAGPYDLYVHLLDGQGRQVAQADTLAWPVDEGPARDDLLLTQHRLNVPAGDYTAEMGAVHRSRADRGQLVGAPIGSTKVPVRIP